MSAQTVLLRTTLYDPDLPTYFKTIFIFWKGSKTGRFDEISPNQMSRRVLKKDKFCEMVEFTKFHKGQDFCKILFA